MASRFNGPMGKGALRHVREEKRKEAEARQAAYRKARGIEPITDADAKLLEGEPEPLTALVDVQVEEKPKVKAKERRKADKKPGR